MRETRLSLPTRIPGPRRAGFGILGLAISGMALLGFAPSSETPGYDPLLAPPSAVPHLELEVTDPGRRRQIPIRVDQPPLTAGALPVVLFSHGLGGGRQSNRALGSHWARRGYLGVFLQHPGSDVEVRREAMAQKNRDILRKAANREELLERVRDVSAVLDALERWNSDRDHPLHGRIDLTRVGLSGHSFGAGTTQRVIGQKGDPGFPPPDPRVRAAIVMSPSPSLARSPEDAFGQIRIPVLLMTGTEDWSPIRELAPGERRKVYAGMPPGDKYELVLWGGEHSTFSLNRNPDSPHSRVLLAFTTAFWDSSLRGDPAARAWLQSDKARQLLGPRDVWQWK